MTYKINTCAGCGDALDSTYSCWNTWCKLAGIIQTPSRGAVATNVTADVPEPKHDRTHADKLARHAAHYSAGPMTKPRVIREDQHGNLVNVTDKVLPPKPTQFEPCEDEGCPHYGTLHEHPTDSTHTQSMEIPDTIAAAIDVPSRQPLAIRDGRQMKQASNAPATLILHLNRVPTEFEIEMLDTLTRIFLKGYNDAR